MADGQSGNGDTGTSRSASLEEQWASYDELEDVDLRWEKKENAVNEETFGQVVRRQRELRNAADDRIDELVDRARSSMRWIRIMSVATFAVGLALVGVALWLATRSPTQGTSTSIWGSLGLGGAGTASVLGVLLYRPVERINRATSDLAQQETLLRAWSIGVDLELMAADTFDRDTVRAAAVRLRESSRELSRSLERYAERSGGTVPAAGQGPAGNGETAEGSEAAEARD